MRYSSMFAETIPETAERYGTLAIACSEVNGVPYVKAWRGKATRPFANYRFRSMDQREQWIAKEKQHEDAIAVARTERKSSKAAGIAKTVASIQPGTILYSSWGYDQTNVDFYQVISKSGRRVKVRKIGQRVNEGSCGCDRVSPALGQFIGEETAHIIGECGVTIDRQGAYVTTPEETHHQTASGWGH